MQELYIKYGGLNMLTNKDDIIAVKNACSKWRGCGTPATPNDLFAFAEWLGDPILFDVTTDTWSRHFIVDMTNPEIRRKIEIINSSSNWYALLKIMEIRREV